jgi:hypothetical protein
MSTNMSYLGNGGGSGDWKRPPSVVDGKEVRVLNNNKRISLTKKQSDPHASPVLVSNLIGDPRKQSLVGKKNFKLELGGEGGGGGGKGGKGGKGGVVVSKYPGRMLPAVKK